MSTFDMFDPGDELGATSLPDTGGSEASQGSNLLDRDLKVYELVALLGVAAGVLAVQGASRLGRLMSDLADRALDNLQGGTISVEERE